MPIQAKFHLVAVKEGFISPFTGGYVRGFFLNRVREKSPELGRYLHDAKTVKPYAVKPLRPVDKKMQVIKNGWRIEEGDNIVFELSVLDESIENEVMNILINNKEYSFGKIGFELDRIEIMRKSYNELASELLKARIGLTFHTPTLFNIRGRKITYLFPDPVRVIGNLLTIWNKFAPEKIRMLTDRLVEWVSDAVEVKSYELRTREVTIENVKVTGFKGRVEWVVLEGERELLTYISPLLKLSEFSNVGEKRTYGLGVVSVKNI